VSNPLSVKVISCGLASLYCQNSVDNPPYKFNISGNIFDSRGQLIKEGLRQSHSGDHVFHDDQERYLDSHVAEIPLKEGRFLYAGHLFDHYGHFITEGLGRLYLLNKPADFKRVLFHPFIFGNVSSSNSLKEFQRIIFSSVGIPERKVQIISTVARYEELWIPEQAWPINKCPHPVMRRLYAKIRRNLRNKFGKSREPFGCERIFIARRGNLRSSRNEVIEKLFRDRGFKVLEPQSLSFPEQIKYYVNAKVVAGFCGSGLHNIVFCPSEAILIEIGDDRNKHKGLLMQNAANSIGENRSLFIDYNESISVIGKILDNI